MISFLVSLFSDGSIYLGLALGLWISLRGLGYPDLSLEQLFVLGGVLYALCVSKNVGIFSLVILLPSVAITLGFGCSILRNKCRVHPILVSLAAAYAYYSFSLVLLEGPSRYLGGHVPPPSLAFAGAVALAVFSVLIYVLTVLSSTRTGLKILAAGSNPNLAERHGISSCFWQGVGLGISFLLTMTSGCLFAWRAGNIDVSYGSGLLLISIFVVVLTWAIQPRIRIKANSALLGLVILGYLALLQVAMLLGMPPQWVRGANAATLLALVLILPKSRARVLSL